MSKPVRMCIYCRKRFDQGELHRFHCRQREIVPFDGRGRSFYICDSCIGQERLSKSLARICKIDPSSALKMLKEILKYG
ncbi:MAG: DUF448 domain-containing protein [Epsilonproteobacteria bacterium]|nr:DUF448 domain-containing protein [Campylobacterota bacterium]NPA56708.1 DUF448 domain-containing protein [Campylobacterota bacterium]